MTESLQIALWGCGTMGKSLARALVETGEARLTVVYDLVSETAAKVAGEYGARVAHSADEMLSTRPLDGVLIAVPPYLHVAAATEAARAGIDIFLEKPMSTHVAGCRQILDAAREHGVKLMVGQVLRYYEPYRSILRWKAGGDRPCSSASFKNRSTSSRKTRGGDTVKSALSTPHGMTPTSKSLDMSRGSPKSAQSISSSNARRAQRERLWAR